MARDVLHPHRYLARLILLVGAAVHFVACIPLYGRRGYPEVDPFWLGMIWLWVPPVFVSAAFDRGPTKRERDARSSSNRYWDLVIYALVTGFAVSWGTIMMVPSYKTAFGALAGLILYGPVMMVGVLIAEGLSQSIWALIRRFAPRRWCEKCQYSLHGLSVPRCPECGASFSPDLLVQDKSMTTTWSRQWTLRVLAFALVSTAMFPFVYRWSVLNTQVVNGRLRAEQAWVGGDYFLFDDAETSEYRDDLNGYIDHAIDPTTGFRRKFYAGGSSPEFFRAYNDQIFSLIAEHGLPAGSMKDHLVDDDYLIAMMDSPGFVEITEFPHDFSPLLFVERGSFIREGGNLSTSPRTLTIGARSAMHTQEVNESVPVLWRYSNEDPEVVFIRYGTTWIGAYHVESGTRLAEAFRFTD